MNPFRSLFLSLSRMPPMLMLMVILGLAVVVTMLVMNQMNQTANQNAALLEQIDREKNQKTTIVRTAKDISEGSLIAADDLEESQIQTLKVPESAIGSASLAQGSYAAVPISQGTVILSGHLRAAIGMHTGGFEGKIKDGMRAITFAVDTNTGVAGFVAPGSHVDVLCSVGAGADTKVAPVMSDVEVIAVGQVYQKQVGSAGSQPASSVTVSVSPEQSAKLVKSIKAGQLYLSLRSDKDHTPVAVVDVTSLFPKPVVQPQIALVPDLPPPVPPGFGNQQSGLAPMTNGVLPQVQPPQHEIELWTGSKKEVLTVPQG
jgi:pilus assembly protein CpaB